MIPSTVDCHKLVIYYHWPVSIIGLEELGIFLGSGYVLFNGLLANINAIKVINFDPCIKCLHMNFPSWLISSSPNFIFLSWHNFIISFNFTPFSQLGFALFVTKTRPELWYKFILCDWNVRSLRLESHRMVPRSAAVPRSPTGFPASSIILIVSICQLVAPVFDGERCSNL